MAFRVRLGNPSKTTRKNVTLKEQPSVPEETSIKMSRIIYQNLGSLAKNKTILEDYENGRLSDEMVDLLNEMNLIYLHKFYDLSESTPIPEASNEVKELDRYLGTLGLTDDYRYSKDKFAMNDFLTYTTQAEVRYLAEIDDDDTNPEVVLVDGDEVLVIYTRENF